MQEYKPPEAKLVDEAPSRLLGNINKALLFLELLLLVLPITLLFGFGSFAVITTIESEGLYVAFIAMWLLTVIAIVGLSLNIVSFIFSLSWITPKWQWTPYLGVLVVFAAYLAQHLTNDDSIQALQIKSSLSGFVLGVVLFIPLTHLQLSQHFSSKNKQNG